MAAPHLDSFLATNFRAFKHLEIPKLHQVNLIVGKNSVGKSCLLEALYVYANGGSWNAAIEVLAARGEMQFTSSAILGTELSTALDGLAHLFYGRTDLIQDSPEIVLQSASQHDMRVAVNVRWAPRRDGPSVVTRNGVTQSVGDKEPFYYSQVSLNGETEQTLVPIGNPNLWLSRELLPAAAKLEGYECVFVSANSLTAAQTEGYWDAIALTDLEREVIESLGVVAHGITGLSLISSGTGQRRPIVRLEGARKPVPLKSLGDGMTRMLGISLAAVNARNGMLLIDEVENGLHYSVQANMWRVLFHLAHELNVQVFATSHSWDCIQAFQQIASERTDVEGGLIRLDRKGELVTPTIFDEEELEIVTREQIEVR